MFHDYQFYSSVFTQLINRVRLFVRPCYSPTLCSSVLTSICPSTPRSVRPYIHLSIYPSVRPSVLSSDHLPLCPSVLASISPSTPCPSVIDPPPKKNKKRKRNKKEMKKRGQNWALSSFNVILDIVLICFFFWTVSNFLD